MRRIERMAILTKMLIEAPQQVFPLRYFCEYFSIAKSTLSEDLTCLKDTLAKQQLGTIETIAGATGGVRYIPLRQGVAANQLLEATKERLQEPTRVLAGGFLYISDIVYDSHLASQLGEILMTRFADESPDYIMTVETKGIPLAIMVARAFNKPLVIARRDSKVTEGSSININYVTGSSRRIQTMSLTKRAIPPGARVLIIDDFMKAGGTTNGMQELVAEMGGVTVGVGVLVATEEPQPKLVSSYQALFVLHGINEQTKEIDIRPQYDSVSDSTHD